MTLYYHALRLFVIVFLVILTLPADNFAEQADKDFEKLRKHGAIIHRTGIWMMQPLPDNEKQLQKFRNAIRTNQYLSGVVLHADWSRVEYKEGDYNFDGFDRAIAVLREQGMPYQLIIKPGTGTPQFIYQKGAAHFQAVVKNPHRPDYGESVTFPLPWDPVYQRHFSLLIKKLGLRYSPDPLCVSVALTCANFLSAEMHLPKEFQDMEKWRLLGDYKSLLLGVYKKYIDEWSQAFPRQEICLHVSPVLDLRPTEFSELIIAYGLSKYPGQFAIQTDMLTGRREDAGKEPYDLVMKLKDRVYHGFQSLAAFARSGERMGSVEMAALNVVHAEGKYWEVWNIDGMKADVSQRILRTWDEAKKSGYINYKATLIARGLYREKEDDTYGKKTRRSRKRAQ
ncbi:MAG: beta-galactosidase [Nitrospirae bacterium]|nr:beta-galactosidase [Nitrospirota bacterium]